MLPTIGRILHITLDDGTVRPAIVIAVDPEAPLRVDIHVFVHPSDLRYGDGSSHRGRSFNGSFLTAPGVLPVRLGVEPAPSDYASENPEVNEPGKRSEPGFWHWPPRA